MKKSLSFLVALALVFGLFASMASAADTGLTTEQKYQQFVDQKILKGDPSGDARLNDTLTRAEFVTIADAINGLAEVTTTQTFSDVTKGQWFHGAIEAAAKAGLVNGIGQGKFGPKLNVTVEQAIKVFVISAGLKPVDGATVDGSSAWAGPFIKAAQDAGFPIPSNFKANATRGQAIDLAYAASVAKSVPTLSDVAAVANADDTITVTGKIVGTADSVKVALGTAAAVAATLKADGTFSYTTAAQAAGDYTLSVVAYDGAKASAASTVKVTVDGFKVVSATVLNAKQIALQFNKAVLEGTSTGGYKVPTNYGLSALGATYANPTAFDLSSDKMTVTLTFKNGFPLNTYGQLDVANVKSASGKTVAAYNQSIYLSDKVAPTVTGVSYSGGVATVSFSEPLADEGSVSINGSVLPYSGITYSVNRNDADHGANITSIDVKGLTAGTNYTLSIVGGQDTAGLINSTVGNTFDYSTTLNVPADSTAPTVVSVTPSGNGQLTVKYSEALSIAGSVYTDGQTALNGTFTDDTKTEVVYNTSAWLAGAHFKTLTIKLSGYKDLVTNQGADYTTSVTLNADTAAPSIGSALYESDGTNNYLVFAFNEAIGTKGTVDWKLVTSNKVVTTGTYAATDATIGYDIDDSQAGPAGDATSENAYVFFTKNLSAGTYTFTLKNFKDVAGNELASATATLTVSDSGSSGIIKLTSVTQDSTGNIKFVFNDAVANIAASSLVPSNFLMNGVALPSDTNLYFSVDQKTVIAELPSGYINATGNRIFSVQNIVDENGNTLNSDFTKSGLVSVTENTKPVAGSVTVVDDRTITVSFNENMTAIAQVAQSVASHGVEVYLNGSSTKADGLSVAVSGSTLTITSANHDTFSTSAPILVKFVGSDIADVAGNKVADSQVSK